ncbi:hypothetical protein D3C81_1262670 [compost metagenome]
MPAWPLRKVNASGVPRLFTRRSPSGRQPACSSSASACSCCLRMIPEPSVTGAVNTVLKTSSGTLPRNGSSSFNSPASGSWRAASGVLENTLCWRMYMLRIICRLLHS